MDWTQALASFAGNYAKAGMARRQRNDIAERQKALQDARSRQWLLDYELKQNDLEARRKADAAKADADEAKLVVDSFDKGVENLATNLSAEAKRIGAITDPISAKREWDRVNSYFQPIISGLQTRYERDPRINRFHNASGNIDFNTFLKSRIASPFTANLGMPGAPEQPSIPLDIEAITKAIQEADDRASGDVNIGTSPQAVRDINAPLLSRLRSAGRTDEEIFSQFPSLAYGIPRQVDVTRAVPTGEWQPQGNVPVPGGKLPGFMDNVQFGGQEYRRMLPETLNNFDPRADFPGMVAAILNDPNYQRFKRHDFDKPVIGMPYGGIRGLPNIPVIQKLQNTGGVQERASSVLTDPGFMKTLGIQSVNEYNDPDVRRRALGLMFATMPNYAKSAAGEEMARMLETAPIERAATKPETVKETRITMPTLPEKVVTESQMRRANLSGKIIENQIAELRRDFDKNTLDDRMAAEHWKATLPPLEYNLKADMAGFTKWAKEKSLKLTASQQQLSRDIANGRYQQGMVYGMPKLMISVVNTANQAVANAGKSLGSAMNQALIQGLSKVGGVNESQMRHIQGKLRSGDELTTYETKLLRSYGPQLKQIEGGEQYFKALDDYDKQLAARDKYTGIRDAWMDYARDATATAPRMGENWLDPYATLVTDPLADLDEEALGGFEIPDTSSPASQPTPPAGKPAGRAVTPPAKPTRIDVPNVGRPGAPPTKPVAGGGQSGKPNAGKKPQSGKPTGKNNVESKWGREPNFTW